MDAEAVIVRKEYPLYTQSWCRECGASWLGDDERHASYCSVSATRAAAATGGDDDE